MYCLHVSLSKALQSNFKKTIHSSWQSRKALADVKVIYFSRHSPQRYLLEENEITVVLLEFISRAVTTEYVSGPSIILTCRQERGLLKKRGKQRN